MIFHNSQKKNFTSLSNEMLRNKSISLKAKGLLAQLLSHTESWKVTIKSLCAYNKEGREAIENAIKELMAEGYMIQNKFRDDLGKFDVEYFVSDNKSDLTDAGFPQRIIRSGLSAADNPLRSIHYNKNINQEYQIRIQSSLEKYYFELQDVGLKLSYIEALFTMIDDDDYEFVFERLDEILEKSKHADKRTAYVATSLENLKEEMKSKDHKKQKEESRKKEEKKRRRGEQEKKRAEMMRRGEKIYKTMKKEDREAECEEIFEELSEFEKKRLEIFGKDVEILPETLKNSIYVKICEKLGDKYAYVRLRRDKEGLEG